MGQNPIEMSKSGAIWLPKKEDRKKKPREVIYSVLFVTFVCCFGFEDSTECLYTFYNVQVIKMTTLSWASHSTMESMPFSKIYFARSLKIFTIRYDENMAVLTYSD